MTLSRRKNKRCLILANGKAPSKRAVKYFFKNGFNYLICADGGADSALKMKLRPDLIIGDLDSISERSLNHFKSTCEVIHYERQNDTDVEKALKYAIRKGFTEAVLCGATGDRMDHTFCNIGVVLKFSEKIRIYLHHENSLMYSMEGETRISTVAGETISIYGIDDSTTFSSLGLKYTLKNFPLPFGKRESTSNIAKGEVVSITCSGGKGLIVRDFNTLVKHGHLFNS